ncbi:MAG: ABC transporter ATP-binding protein [bacterium]|jgi:ABC-type multidrug transport system fused ATPase/permease subunit
MKIHHRNIRFRPPRREYESAAGHMDLYFRFVRDYVWPYRRILLAISIWWIVNAWTPFLMAWYGRVVVDSILVVTSTPDVNSPSVSPQNTSPIQDDRRPEVSAPSGGLTRDRGPELSVRPAGAMRMLGILFGVYLLTLILSNIGCRMEARARIRISQGLTARLREDLHQKVMRLSLAYHKSHAPGRLMSRILSDVGEVQDQLYMTFLTFLSALTAITTGLVILFMLDWRFGAIALLTLPAYMITYRRSRHVLKEVNSELRHTNSWMYALASQKLDSMRAIQSYGRERHEDLNYHRLSACFLRDTMLQQHTAASLGALCTVIAAIGTGSLFLYGTSRVLAGEMSLGTLMYANGVTAVLFGPVIMLSQLNVTLSKLLVVLQRLVQVLDEKETIAEAPDSLEFPSPLKRGITLLNSHFRHEQQIEPVLEDITLHIPAGSWMCLMGPSGCGKSTLLHLLGRLYEPVTGEIYYDHVPLDRIRSEDLHKRVVLVPQEPQIFGGSIRDNICYGNPDASPRDIIAAAQAAEIHDHIMGLPVKYETLIGEKGMTLSGGQRQRITLARALLSQPDVLLLDDCMSALDAETERRIQATLVKILKGRTAVIVSQRASMAMRCQRICVLDGGVVAETGTHDELSKGNGFYARLYRQQTR